MLRESSRGVAASLKFEGRFIYRPLSHPMNEANLLSVSRNKLNELISIFKSEAFL